MKILMTGATGFVGRPLVQRLLRDGHALSAYVRDPGRAQALLGPTVGLVNDDGLRMAVADADVVINLAGEGLFDQRWSVARKEVLRNSRLELTGRLVEAMASSPAKPRTLVSASAIGIYGDRAAERLAEDSSAGGDYLATLCGDWERAALTAEKSGARVAIVRIGLVLGAGGGALGKLLPIFRLGGGGRLASGHQYMSFIHLDDLVELFRAAATDERYRGVFNATAPNAVTNREFTAALARAVRRPALFPVPALALRAVVGEASTVLLSSQRVEPRRATLLGFVFQYPNVASALGAILGAE